MKNKSDVKVMLKEALVLLIITLGAGLLLGFVYELTKDPIAEQKKKAIARACQAVFAEATEFEEYSITPSEAFTQQLADTGVEIGTMYTAKATDGTTLGYVVEATSGEGYGGDIVLYVGVTLLGEVKGVSILEISETPGLGMQADKVLTPQFPGKTVESFTYTKTGSMADNEIDAISGATITTEAVVNAVNGALSAVQELADEGGAQDE